MVFTPVILAGGKGEHFWPLSRLERPKQFLCLDGSDRSLLQATADRLLPLANGWENLWVITTAHLADRVRQQLPKLPEANLLIEPDGRDTAPAVAWTTLEISQRHGPDAVVGFFPADHWIDPPEAFHHTLYAAIEVAQQQGAIVTLGVQPTYPSTGYGYIEQGEPQGTVKDLAAFQVARFTEKPDRPTAETFLASGRFSWNSGIFIFQAGVALEELRQYAPELMQQLQEKGVNAYPKLTKISIDYALMEKTQRAAVLPVSFGWSDLIASWQEEQRKRLAAERTLEELKQRQTQVKRRTRWLSAAGVIIMAVAVGCGNRELQQTTPSDQNYGTVRSIESLGGVVRDIRLRNTWEAHSGPVRTAEFNGDGTMVVSASDDGTVKLWDVSSGELLHSLQAHSGPVRTAEFNGDGTVVVSASLDGTVKLWDVSSGELLQSLEAHSRPVWTAEFNGDGTMVVSASYDGTVKLWDVSSGELLQSLEAHSDWVYSAFNGDGTMVVSASWDGTVKLWDVSSGELLHSLEAHSDDVVLSAFNGDGTMVVSASWDGTVKLWDVSSGELLHSLETDSGVVLSAEFNRDGTMVVSASEDGTVNLWDVSSGELLHSLQSDLVTTEEFNGDGTMVVSASLDGTVKLWDVSSGELLHSLEAHSDWVYSAEFNRDGTMVVSASEDGTVKLWEMGTFD